MEERRLLVVEDEASVRNLMTSVLEDEGYTVLAVDDGRVAVEAFSAFRPHLALLDNGIPGLDGRTVARRLREQSEEIAILFVTGADSVEDRVEGLRAGGGDYLLKPFAPEELLARVANLLRRHGSPLGQVWRLGGDDLVVDERAREVRRRGHLVDLRPIDFEILVLLVRRRGTVVSKRELLREVWSYDEQEDEHVVEVHMSTLRQALESEGPRLIHTVRGGGYVLRPPSYP